MARYQGRRVRCRSTDEDRRVSSTNGHREPGQLRAERAGLRRWHERVGNQQLRRGSATRQSPGAWSHQIQLVRDYRYSVVPAGEPGDRSPSWGGRPNRASDWKASDSSPVSIPLAAQSCGPLASPPPPNLSGHSQLRGGRPNDDAHSWNVGARCLCPHVGWHSSRIHSRSHFHCSPRRRRRFPPRRLAGASTHIVTQRIV